MRNQAIGAALALAVSAGWPSASVAQEVKAAEILAATRKAIGDAKLEAMKALSVNATVQRNSGNFRNQMDVEMLLEMPDKYLRSETMGGGIGVMTTGFNGEKAIMPAGMRVMPGGGTTFVMRSGGAADPHVAPEEKPTPEQMEQLNKSSLRSYRQEVSRLMLGWFGSTHPALKATYTYVGEAESPDGKAYVLDVKDADGFAARLFIDQNSKLPLMVTFQGRAPRIVGGPGGITRIGGGGGGAQVQVNQSQIDQLTASAAAAPMVEVSMFFEDWKEVDGINFPHLIRRASEGQTTEEWTISKVKVNPKVDPKKFETK